MRKTIYLINSLLAVALFSMLIAVLSVTHSVAFAATEDSLKSNVSVTGEDIVEGNTYYLQWSNLSVVYNGSSQVSAAVLKCNEDSSFEKTATVYVKNKAGEAVTAVNVGDYVAVAECDGISFGEKENEKTFRIDACPIAVTWGETSHEYDGNTFLPTATAAGINGETVNLTVSGGQRDSGDNYTATASTTNGNYTLQNPTVSFKIDACSVAVDWSNTTGFTYNGKAQGPAASVATLEGTVELTPSGYGTNAGPHTARVTADAAGNNYALTNLICNYEIAKLPVAVDWSNTTGFTYNGKAQGPAASVATLEGTVELTPSGWGTDAGTHTASITADAAGSNYELSPLTCEYVIGKFAGKVLWVASDYYIANGKPQGPRAFVVGANGDIIELPIKVFGTTTGEYTAEIDISKIDKNMELSGETSQNYKISSEKQLGPVGIVFLVLLIGSAIGVGCWIFLRQKKDKELKNEKKDIILKAQREKEEKDKTIERLQRNIQLQQSDLDEMQGKLDKKEATLSRLERELKDSKKLISASECKAFEGRSIEKEKINELNSQVSDLTEQVQRLSEENKKLKNKKPKEPKESEFYRRPIEDYFPEIDEAFKRAREYDFDEQDPIGSFASQRQELENIKRLIAIYRSQRR